MKETSNKKTNKNRSVTGTLKNKSHHIKIRPKLLVDLVALEESDKLNAAAQAAGRYVIGNHYHLKSSCHIWRWGAPSMDMCAYVGRAYFGPTSKLKEAAIICGGLIAVEMRRTEYWPDELPSEPDTAFFDDSYFLLEDDSPVDFQIINECGSPIRAFKMAWKVIYENQGRLKSIAETLAKSPEKTYTEDGANS